MLGPLYPQQPIETPRLSLRPWSVSDAEALREALDTSDASLRPWLAFMQKEPRALEETRQRLAGYAAQAAEGRVLRYAIWCGEALCGEVLLIHRDGACELGYWLAVEAVGHGYVTEAARALIQAAFAIPITDEIVMKVERENHASNRVAERLGATLKRTEPGRTVDDLRDVEMCIWAVRRA